MNKECISALHEILSKNEMTDECKQVIKCLIGSVKAPNSMVITDLFGENEVKDDYKIEVADENLPLKDLRLNSIELVNIRSFYGNKSEDQKNFGLKLSVNNMPVSLFLVGGNSTGKSSVFSALENYYTGNVSQAKAVNNDETKYMTFGFGRLNNPHVGYKITSSNNKKGWVSLQEGGGISTSASFCSDYDIERIEKSGDNLNSFVLEQMGYGDLFVIYERLNFLLQNLKTSYDISKQKFSSSEWTEIIEEFVKFPKNLDLNNIESFRNENNIRKAVSEDVLCLQFPSRWKLLAKESAVEIGNSSEIGFADYFLSNTSNEKGLVSAERLAMMYNELYKRVEEVQKESISIVDVLNDMYICRNSILEMEKHNAEMPMFSETKKNVLLTVSYLIKDKCNQILENIYKNSHLFIEDILKRFSPKSEKYQFNFYNGILSTRIEVTTDRGTFPAAPQNYLNTFRFKLYCVTLKIALAFSKMKERRISVPIVIDDIFNASDFENTMKLEQFVYTIYKTYDEVLKDDKPLQLILLTHDEMVQGAFRRGIKLRIDELGKVQLFNNDAYRDYFLCGRLFNKEECMEYYCREECESSFINLYIEN